MSEIKKTLKFNTNIRIFFYIAVVILSELCSVYYLQNIKYVLLIIYLFLVITEKKDNFLPILLFMHPCLSIFDDLPFLYTFNLTIFIFMVKILSNKDYYFSKKITFLVIILFLYELILNLLNGYLDISLLSLISLMSSYFLVMFLIKKVKSINIEKCLKYFFFGFTLSAILGIVNAFLKWGIDVPVQFRYMGLFRDPNYYSLDGLIIMFSSLCIYKKINLKFLITFGLCIISISKMFLLVSIAGLLIYVLVNNNKINGKRVLNTLPLIGVFAFIFFKTSLYDLVYSKYISRISTVTSLEALSTGRSSIIVYYLTQLINNPFYLFFGSSLLNYTSVLVDSESKYALYAAHNTYLELLLSWGIIGFSYYIYLIRNYYSEIKMQFNATKIKLLSNESLLIMIFLVSIFSLSLIGADVFIVLLYYIFIVVSKGGEKTNEKNT